MLRAPFRVAICSASSRAASRPAVNESTAASATVPTRERVRATASAVPLIHSAVRRARVIDDAGEPAHRLLHRGGPHLGGLPRRVFDEHRGDPLDGLLMRSL